MPSMTGRTPRRTTARTVAGTDKDHARGLAERSVNTSIVHPSESRPDVRKQGAPPGGARIVTDNDQREGLEKLDPTTTKSSKAAQD